MTAPSANRQKRVRASPKALEVAFDELERRGLSVEKLCVAGGQIEIFIRDVDGDTAPENHGGLKTL